MEKKFVVKVAHLGFMYDTLEAALTLSNLIQSATVVDGDYRTPTNYTVKPPIEEISIAIVLPKYVRGLEEVEAENGEKVS